MDKPEDYCEVVANGGFLTHIKKNGVHASLCGHSPSSPKGFKFDRGRWKWSQPVEIDGKRLRWCRKCRVKYLRAIGNYRKAMTE